MKTSFEVKLKIPKGVSVREVMAYIKESVQAWKGQYHPYTPLFDLDTNSVTIKQIKKDKKK